MKKRTKWFLYMLLCKDGSYYTGITLEPVRRLAQHNAGKASRYTRARLPVKMIYLEKCKSQSLALRREYEVKSLSRRQKEKLIK
jgi:putative endonuclease